jgi:hypothetical protein
MLALPMLLLAVLQAIVRQDAWLLVRSALGYLPMAFIFAAVAIVGTQLIIAITDDLARTLVSGLGGTSDNLLKTIGDAFDHAIHDQGSDGLPLFGIFLGALVLMVGSLVLWLELVIRAATIYIALFFLPLTFVAMIWPATSRYARRLCEFLIAVILSKLVIVAIIALSAAALTNSGALGAPGVGGTPQDSQLFERMVAGGALLVLAAYSPFALLRAIPLVEGAMASVGQTKRQATSAVATGAGGVQSTASHLKQAMSRQPEAFPSTSVPVSTTTGGPSASGSSAASAWARSASAHSEPVAADAASARSALPVGAPGTTAPAAPTAYASRADTAGRAADPAEGPTESDDARGSRTDPPRPTRPPKDRPPEEH